MSGIGEGERGEVWGGWWTVKASERGRAGCLDRSEWDFRVLGESDEILGTVL